MKKASQISAIVFLGVFVFLSMGNSVNASHLLLRLSSSEFERRDRQHQIKYIDQAGTMVTSTTDTINRQLVKNLLSHRCSFSFQWFRDHRIRPAGRGYCQYRRRLGTYGASTTGFSSGSTSINLPLLMKGNSGIQHLV